MNERNILIVGDIHGVWSALNFYVNGVWPHLNNPPADDLPDEIWCVGDFGYWPRTNSAMRSIKRIKNVRKDGTMVTIRWIDGNHEDHQAIQELLARVTKRASKLEQRPGIFYQPRGSHLTLPDGRVVAFIGGAKSVDWQWRHRRNPDCGWFPEEVLTEADLAGLPERADIVISHTLPTRFRGGMFGPPYLDEAKCRRIEKQTDWDLSGDPSEAVLDQAFERLKPKLWYFGHFYRYLTGRDEGCQWTALGDLSDLRGGSWAWLPPADVDSKRNCQ